jgi:hypothetical protein
VLLFDENEYTRLDQEELVEKNIAWCL